MTKHQKQFDLRTVQHLLAHKSEFQLSIVYKIMRTFLNGTTISLCNSIILFVSFYIMFTQIHRNISLKKGLFILNSLSEIHFQKISLQKHCVLIPVNRNRIFSVMRSESSYIIFLQLTLDKMFSSVNSRLNFWFHIGHVCQINRKRKNLCKC